MAGNDDYRHDVFVSYSFKDKTVADAIVADLEAHGIRCWYAPRDEMPGAAYARQISGAIRSARMLVLVYTEEANRSLRVKREVTLAAKAGRVIVPFVLSDAQMNATLDYHLSGVHWLDAVDKPLKESIGRLREEVEAALYSQGCDPHPMAYVRHTNKESDSNYSIEKSSGTSEPSKDESSAHKATSILAIPAAILAAPVIAIGSAATHAAEHRKKRRDDTKKKSSTANTTTYPASTTTTVSDVRFEVLTPSTLVADQYAVIDVVMHEKEWEKSSNKLPPNIRSKLQYWQRMA